VTLPTLKGMTWNHPRGFESVVACNDLVEKTFGVSVDWRARSLLEFGDQHVREFSPTSDLMVIDHPHVADAVHDGAVIAFDDYVDPKTLQTLRKESAGPSHDSYLYDGKVWGLAIDGACQVSVYRPDLIDGVPPFWEDVFRDAAKGKVLWPHKPVDAFSTFATLMAQRGAGITVGDTIINREIAGEVLDMLIELASLVPDWCHTSNPFEISEALVGSDDYYYATPLYGYTNYSRDGFRDKVLHYDDVVSFDGLATGSQLGGAGIAVSSATADPELACAIAVYLASAEAQNGPYTERGGQPGNLRAWLSPRMNALTGNFFRNTLRSMEGSWVRPRVVGWPDFQFDTSQVIHRILAEKKVTSADWADIGEIEQRLRVSGGPK
jgi:multiple sugar transport system substrate-binding protein